LTNLKLYVIITSEGEGRKQGQTPRRKMPQ